MRRNHLTHRYPKRINKAFKSMRVTVNSSDTEDGRGSIRKYVTTLKKAAARTNVHALSW
ncbi:MAG: hypothetical protein ACXVB0_06910 [Mucilaginibacter sp.]